MISVIIPYNKDRGYLDRCIASIEIQEGAEFEIVLAKGDQSVAKNFNEGLARCKGDYCKFVCEDDYLPQYALMNLVNGVGRYWAFANAYQETGEERWTYKPGDYSKDFLTLSENIKTNRIHGGTTIYNTEMIRYIGGMDESLWTSEEYDMHLKLWSSGFVPNYIDRWVYVHTLWSGQKSKILRKTKKDEREKEIKRIQSLYSDQIQQRSI